MSLKVYISGKISGDPNYREKFRAAADKLTAAGHIVLNPAVQPAGLRLEDYLRVCFAMMEAADTVVFLHDYCQSSGAMLELAWCKYVGKPIAYNLDGLILEAAT